MTRKIELEYLYPYPPELIWSCLTESDKLAGWLMQNDFKPVAGHRFTFVTVPKVKFGFDGIVYGEVLEVVPFRKLVYSWRGGPGNGHITLDTIVTWTLKPVNGGTRLTLTHSGFRGLSNFVSYFVMGRGWQKITRRKLVNFLKNMEHANLAG